MAMPIVPQHGVVIFTIFLLLEWPSSKLLGHPRTRMWGGLPRSFQRQRKRRRSKMPRRRALTEE